MAALTPHSSKSKNSLPKVYQQAAFTAEGTAPSFAKPATDLVTFNPLVIQENPQGGQWLFVWANYCRANGNANPPIINGRGFRYSSVAKANTATLAKLRSAFLDPSYAKALCRNQGLRFCLWGDLETLATMPIVGGHYRDVAYCPPYVKDKVTGFLLDYEVGDHRSPQVTSAFFKRLVGEMFYIPRGLYTNQVDSAGYRLSGLGSIERETFGRFHGVSILQDHNERDLARQAAKFGNAYRKIVVTVDLATNNLDSIRYARNFIRDRKCLGAHLWRNGVDLAAPLTAQKLNLFSAWGTL